MRLVIEVDDVSMTYLENMQAESDKAWAGNPDDGSGSMGLQTPYMGVNARILVAEQEDGTRAYLSGNRHEEQARALEAAAGVLEELAGKPSPGDGAAVAPRLRASAAFLRRQAGLWG